MTISLERTLDLFNELIDDDRNGTIEPDTSLNYDVFDPYIDFKPIIDEIAANHGGKIETIDFEYGSGIVIIWFKGFYFAIDYNRNFNQSFTLNFKLCYFINYAEKYLNVSVSDDEMVMDVEPSGIVEDE